jgi:hypothetical protein
MDGQGDEAARVTEPASPRAATPSAATQQVTLTDDGRTLNLAMGAHFLLALGWDYDWRVEVTNPRVLGRIINISVVRGAQGVYEARESGKSDLVATGIPVCRSAKPPCNKPARTFRIHLIIERNGVPATPSAR